MRAEVDFKVPGAQKALFTQVAGVDPVFNVHHGVALEVVLGGKLHIALVTCIGPVPAVVCNVAVQMAALNKRGKANGAFILAPFVDHVSVRGLRNLNETAI